MKEKMNTKACNLKQFDVIKYNGNIAIIMHRENHDGGFGGDYTKLFLFYQAITGKAVGNNEIVKVIQCREFFVIAKVSTLDW